MADALAGLGDEAPVLSETPAGLELSGALTLDTVASVFRDATPLLESSARAASRAGGGAVGDTGAPGDVALKDVALKMDLARVARSDSAALAVLVQWRRIALVAGARLTFINAPAQLLAIARVCALEGWLLGSE